MADRTEPTAKASVIALLTAQHKTLSTAESCTGGWIAKVLTDVPGASQVFRGGVVSYTNQVKHDLLQVPQEVLDTRGAVSAQVAQAMAEGARRVLGSDLAVSVTGLAGPESDDFGHTGGTVFLGCSDGTRTWVQEQHLGTDRTQVRQAAVRLALEMVVAYLTGQPVAGEERAFGTGK